MKTSDEQDGRLYILEKINSMSAALSTGITSAVH